MTTIRGLMLAQQARHSEHAFDDPGFRAECDCCAEAWPCADRVAADAVLATLDASTRYDRGDFISPSGNCRLVPDPPDPGVS